MILHSLGSWKSQALDTLRTAGIVTKTERYERVKRRVTLNDGSVRDLDDCLDLLKNASTDRVVRLFEPLLILFEDGNTLELLPCAPKGLRIGFNTLPKNMRDGANRSEFDVGSVFNQYVSGSSFSMAEVISTIKTKKYSGNWKPTTNKRNEYSFSFSNGWLTIKELQCSEYELSFSHAETIKCGELAALGTISDQFAILEGCQGGGADNIYPVNGTTWDEIEDDADKAEAMAVLYHVPSLFHPMLVKYFDPELPVNKNCSIGKYHFYYWNYYTKEVILKMIDETRRELERARSLSFTEQCELLYYGHRDATNPKAAIWIFEELDFTERFLDRLSGMALNSPAYEFISFNGP